MFIGLWWTGLTLCLDLVYGHYVLEVGWDALVAHYNPMQGRPAGMLLAVLLLGPLLIGAQWVRGGASGAAPATAAAFGGEAEAAGPGESSGASSGEGPENDSGADAGKENPERDIPF